MGKHFITNERVLINLYITTSVPIALLDQLRPGEGCLFTTPKERKEVLNLLYHEPTLTTYGTALRHAVSIPAFLVDEEQLQLDVGQLMLAEVQKYQQEIKNKRKIYVIDIFRSNHFQWAYETTRLPRKLEEENWKNHFYQQEKEERQATIDHEGANILKKIHRHILEEILSNEELKK
ncbi:MAG: hypothetical protein Q7R56_02745 [Nanoarchaeota archaeon]|nr:hypothetical protein [Nanoarchaeota archaeon]